MAQTNGVHAADVNTNDNYVAYRPNDLNQDRIGVLDTKTGTITPVSYLSGTPITNLYQVIEAGKDHVIASAEQVKLSDVKILPPISGRDVLAVGKNYAEHAKEFNSSGYDSSDKTDQPSHPVIFTKRATSIIADGDDILPHDGFTESVDYEGEIGVIIGKPGYRIAEQHAMDHVWGYTIINDMTARERQRDHKQFYIGKSPDTFCPIGPVARPKESLPEILEVSTFVNGERRQNATTKDLIFSVPFLVHTLSQGQTLQLGDVIATGTPAGVGFGFRPMRFLKPGDEIKVTVTGLGSLVNRIAPLDAVNSTKTRISSKSYAPVMNQKTVSQDGLTQVGDKRLFYKRLGDEQSSSHVLFIHGLGGSSEYFRPLIAQLEKQHCLHLTDLEGHGLSPTSAMSALSIPSFAIDLKELLQQAGVTSDVTLVAHSMGCHVAVQLALTNPQLIRKIVLMGPPPSPLPEAGAKATFARAALVRRKGMLSVVETIVEAGISARSRAENPMAVTATRLSLLSQDPEGYAKACMALAAVKAIDYGNLGTKTLLLTGSDDKVSPPSLCEQYKTDVKSSTLQVLEDVGHWHLFEKCDLVVRTVTDFLT